jgi:hypothetical protein
MPRIQYIERNFRGASLEIIRKANEICRDYRSQGYNLTLRQLYYQFVARDLIPNSQKSYKSLGSIINDARLAGELDWSYIEDRTRNMAGGGGGWDDPAQIIEASASQFRYPMWERSQQPYRPEVWVEKEALADVVAQACHTYRVPYFSCRGYVSQSEMWSAGQRMMRHFQAGLVPVVIHLGDHDPSGIDMTRDIEDRLGMFAGRHVEVRRIALNMDQVEEYEPPPNPAKISDSRAVDYISRFGDESWELDALEPRVLTSLIRDTLTERYVDVEAFEAVVAEEEEVRRQMTLVADRWDDISDRWPEVESLLDD